MTLWRVVHPRRPIMASSRQDKALARIRRIDADAEHHETEGLVFVTYTPRWEKGRMANGEFRPNPNPARITHVLDEAGRTHGWGYGPVKVKIPKVEHVTTA